MVVCRHQFKEEKNTVRLLGLNGKAYSSRDDSHSVPNSRIGNDEEWGENTINYPERPTADHPYPAKK